MQSSAATDEHLVMAEPWARTSEDVLRELASEPDGLLGSEVERRRRTHGPNELEQEAAVRPAAILLRQFRSPLIYILIVAAVVTIALDEYVDAAVIAAVLVFNAVVGIFQEYRAERSLEALRRLARAQAAHI
jgi:magnesium-transporting ATPase (P-type)